MKIRLIPSLINPDLFLRMYKSMLVKLMDEYESTKAMSEINRVFNKQDIDVALASIYIDGPYIVTNSSNRLLRLLEFGGPNIKALNLLTKASRKLGGSYND